MEDSKLNKRVQGAVRSGGKKLVSGARGALGKLHLWQKAGLALCLLSWIVSGVIGAVCGRLTRSMIDQNCAARWAQDRESAQVSAFVSGAAAMSDETVQAVYSGFMRTLQEDAIGLSETQIENGASLIDVCYCGIGNTEISAGEEAVNATMIGVGGDFFNFHPLDLMDGYYFSEDELMQDRVLLDDETAWRLFGSSHVVGMQVNIGGTPHYIAGVFRRPSGRFYKHAGMGNYTVFISFDSLCRYTEAGSPAEGGSGGTDSDMLDARLPSILTPGPERTAGGMRQSAPAAPDSVSLTAAGTGAGPSKPAAAALSFSSAAEKRLEEAVSPGRESGKTDIPPTAAWQPAGTEASRIPSGDGTMEEELHDKQTPAVKPAEEEADGGTAGSGMDAGEDAAESKEEEEEEDGTEEDLDKLEPGDSSMRGDTGSSVGKSQDEAEAPEKEEVNRGRINCYEVIMPDPVSGYAVMNVRKCLEEAGISSDQCTIVENSSRFDTFRLASMVAQPGVRSMQTAAIRYPYWENVALAWEDTLIPYALLQLLLRYAPLLFLLYLLLWYATHKSWTIAGLIEAVQDRIYERESERIYGKPSADKLTTEADSKEGIASGETSAGETSAGEISSEEISAAAIPMDEGHTESGQSGSEPTEADQAEPDPGEPGQTGQDPS